MVHTARPRPMRRRTASALRAIAAVAVGCLALAATEQSGVAASSPAASSPVHTKWLSSHRFSSGVEPATVVVDSSHHRAYLADASGHRTVVLNTRTGQHWTLNVPSWGGVGSGIAVDPSTGDAYVPGEGVDQINVVRGHRVLKTFTLPSGSGPEQAIVDPVGHYVYVVDAGLNALTVIKHLTVVATVPLDHRLRYGAPARFGAANTSNGDVVIPETSGLVFVKGTKVRARIDGLDSPGYVAIDSSRNLTYASDIEPGSTTVYVVTGAGRRVQRATVGGEPTAIAVNPRTHLAYVTDAGPVGPPATLGRTSILRGTRVLRTISGGAQYVEAPDGIDRRTGAVLVPSSKGLKVLRRRRVVANVRIHRHGVNVFSAFDQRSGRAVVSILTGDRVRLLKVGG